MDEIIVNNLPENTSPTAADKLMLIRTADGELTLVSAEDLGNVIGGAVTSVNGQTGAVVIVIPTKTSDLTNDSGFVNAAGAAAAAPVQNPATAALDMGGNKVTGLGAPVNTGDAATKGYVDDAISGLGTVFNIKGDVATVADLPASGNTVGDVYYVQAVSAAFIWLETTAYPTGYWEEFGEPIDLSGYIEKPASPSAGQFLVFDGTDWVAQTLATWSGGSY